MNESKEEPARRLRVAFVGPIMQENLALQYLSAVVHERGHEHVLVGYDTRDDLGRAAKQIAELEPDLVGIAVPFQFTISDAFAIAGSLRAHGCTAHITCGGHVPTFCYAEMLRDCEALDTVVRHEAEETILEMLRHMENGEPLAHIDGLVWREEGEIVVANRRHPVRHLDEITPPLRPAEPYRVAGVPVAFIVTARGCIGECDYCSIRAFGKDAGGAPFRLRAPEPVADEIADLYHRAGARVFFVQDDIFVLPSEKKTVERMDAITEGLAKRGVGKVAFWIKGRPETITPAVLEAAQRMGAIHMFMGIENASAERLEYLGRLHKPHHNREAIALCRAHGVHPSFNFMLFDPDCSMDDVKITLEFAETNLGMPYNFCRTEIYSGTGLLTRLAEQGRLQGDYLSYGYVMRDARAELMFRILRVCFHERAFAFDSLLNKLISLSFARQIHQHFFPGPAMDRADRDVQSLIDEVHRDCFAMLWRVYDFAVSADLEDHAAMHELAVTMGLEASRRDLGWHARAQALWDMFNITGVHRTGGPRDTGGTLRQPAWR
ncbi:MAG: radical SAM protein [Sandaracinaceae bacterium]